MKKIIECLIYIYVVTLMFGGIITKFLVGNTTLMNLKSMSPDIIIILIIFFSAIEVIRTRKKGKKSLFFLLLLNSYIILIFVLNLYSTPKMEKILLILRDTCLPFLALFLLMKITFSNREKIKIEKVLIIIFSLQIVGGFILGITQHILDWEWTSKFYVGYSFYGLDPISNVKIWHGNGGLRVPSLAGNSVLFAFYNYICYVIIKYSKVTMKKILIILSLLNICLSTTKTVIVLVIIEMLIHFIIISKPKLKLIIAEVSILFLMVIFCVLPLIDKNIYFSMGERLIHWNDIITTFNIGNYILPLNLFGIGAGTTGAYGFIDNAFLYFLLSYGIIGLIIYIIFIISNLTISIKNNIYIITAFWIGLVVASISVNIFQGRTYISVIFILYFIYYRKNNEVI